MAEKGWTAQVAAAAGVAAGTGAAQLGLGYGLGVVVWPAVPAVDDSVWLGSLGWATWIAASSTVFGAVIAGRLGRAAGGPWRFALAASAAVGALLTVALIALPARAAVRTDTFSPHTIAGGYAVIGVLLGLIIAYWAVVSKPVADNLIATAAWLWSLAVAAIVVSIFWHRPSATYLSSWQFAAPDPLDGQYGTIYWPSALLTLLAALIVGVIGALPAVRRGDLGVGAATSGAVGPLLVAAAFFVLAPQLTGALGPLESAYLIAPYAVLAGLAGSAMVVALGQRRAARAAQPSPVAPSGPDSSARSRPSLLGRLRRSGAGQGDADRSGDRPAVVTGRAKAPASAGSSAPPKPRKPSAGSGSAKSRAAEPRPAEPKPAQPKPSEPKPAQPNPTQPKPAGSRAAASKPTAGEPTAMSSQRSAPAPVAPPTAAGSASPRGKAPVARAASRSQATSVDGDARPSASDSRSTVAPPPTAPPVAKINPPRSGETPPTATKPARTEDADIASSDKTPPGRKTAPKPTKTTQVQTEDSDTAELPIQEPRKRGLRRLGRRSGEDESS